MNMRTVTWALSVVVIMVGLWWLYTHTGTRTVPTTGEVTQQTDIDGNPYPSDKAPAPAPAPAAAPIATPSTVSAATTPTAAVTPTPAATVPATATPSSAPTNDTLERNAPSGMAFGGSGRFQWYRQGNLTWRIDTRSGSTCVDFATMDEWQKPIVYSNGCRFRA